MLFRSAAEDIRKEFGFKPDNWYARVFKYGASTTEVGPLEEYFYNPTGSKMRQIDKNDEEHGRMFHEKVENEDV